MENVIEDLKKTILENLVLPDLYEFIRQTGERQYIIIIHRYIDESNYTFDELVQFLSLVAEERDSDLFRYVISTLSPNYISLLLQRAIYLVDTPLTFSLTNDILIIAYLSALHGRFSILTLTINEAHQRGSRELTNVLNSALIGASLFNEIDIVSYLLYMGATAVVEAIVVSVEMGSAETEDRLRQHPLATGAFANVIQQYDDGVINLVVDLPMDPIDFEDDELNLEEYLGIDE